MADLLSHTVRRAAHGKHVCRFCRRLIAAGERYNDDRLAEDGSAYTFRSHVDCLDAWSSWDPDEYDTDLRAISDGHLPPCPLAWDTDGSQDCACPSATCTTSTPEADQ